ncbi:hypothetical protein ACN0IV_04380 [Trabulsiella odontotermitis]|uniref:hypothetical protein n=1 Tax=Trabulsiella odontotermitis TaxID=379893 RepID=UPI003ACF53C5
MRIALYALLFISLSLPGVAGAREQLTGPVTTPSDWVLNDRLLWDQQRQALTPEQLTAWFSSAPNTFVQAADYNTRNYLPDEYTDIRQRHSYYDLISYLIEHDDKTAAPVRDVTFFHAVTAITIPAEHGGVDVNQTLFRRNMRVIQDLLFHWQAPRDPRAISPKENISALDFDIYMVDFEQSIIFSFIDSNAVPNVTLRNVNKTIGTVWPLATLRQVRPWLKAAGFKQDDFADYRWRVAVGRAQVFLFHRKSRADYLSFMKANPPAQKTREKLYSAIFSPVTITRDTAGYFTVLGSWKTEQGARRHVAELQSGHLGLDVAVFPPYGKNRYWTVVSSSYVGKETAVELQRAARTGRVAADAFVLRHRAVDPQGNAFTVSPSMPEIINLPGFLRAATEENMPIEASYLLSVYRNADETLAKEKRAALMAQYPTLDVSLLKSVADNSWLIALATFATQADIEAAKKAVNRLGIPLADITVSTFTRPDQLVKVIDGRAVSQSTWGIVNRCYSTGQITVKQMHDCSGFWLTPSSLTRCILESNCRVLDDRQLNSQARIEEFLSTQKLDLTTRLVGMREAVPLSNDAKHLVNQIHQCQEQSQSDKQKFETCVSTLVGMTVSPAAMTCAQQNVSGNALLKCVTQASMTPEMQAVQNCVQGDHPDPLAVTKCLAGPEKAAAMTKVETCLTRATSQENALSGCIDGIIPADSREKVDCLTAAGANSGKAIHCVVPANSDAGKVTRALACANNPSATRDAALNCLTPLLGPDAGKAQACLENSTDNRSLVMCMAANRPELQAAQRVYQCVSQGADAATLIASCSDGILDERTRHVAGCVATTGGDKGALAGCIASTFLPKEYGPALQCAGSSTGGVSFALCMAGPSMNEELRITAECAVQSGGTPPAFAVCTAGRLTLRELGKCLSGKIGSDDGCFGPNNSIVVAFKTVGHDLESCVNGGDCLGRNNDIINALAEIGGGLRDLGDSLQSAWDGLFGKDSDICRGDLTKIVCR